MSPYPQVRVKPKGFRLPATRHEWGGLLLGLAAILHGLGRLIQGDTDTSVWLEISAGLGTFGLPSLVKEHTHIEIVSDRPLDMTALHDAAARVVEDMRIGGPDDDTDDVVPDVHGGGAGASAPRQPGSIPGPDDFGARAPG